jgi:hypothetical protein
MSFSFRLPEENPTCECKYDEAHDRIDKDDCAFHCDMVEDAEPANGAPAERKPPASIVGTTGLRKSASGTGDRVGH